MACRALRHVMPRGTAMQAHALGVAAQPAQGVWIAAADGSCADTAPQMAPVAAARLVTSETTGGLLPRLDRVPGDVVAAVDIARRDPFGLARFDAERLRGVVAVGARRLRVADETCVTQPRSRHAVRPYPRRPVPHEALRHGANERTLRVARRASVRLEIPAMTGQARLHRRRGGGGACDVPVAAGAIPAHVQAPVVRLVREPNGPRARPCLRLREPLLCRVAVASRAGATVGRARTGQRTVAGSALPTHPSTKVPFVREPHRCSHRAARAREHAQEQDEGPAHVHGKTPCSYTTRTSAWASSEAYGERVIPQPKRARSQGASL
jgi:hypothetical protein